uniref:Uncharacterized protein n=1 Tax=Tanacetum cinerariifolium TaxID=118510 RepID=A0A699RBM1_TANCI|nr:hypothetical protein [Tanacetum cinerariifolium]
MPEDAPTRVSDPDPLCFADPSAHPSADVAQSSSGVVAAEDPDSASGIGVTAAPQVQTRGQAAEEIRGPGGSPG